jgi:hypothetical protein
MTVSSIPLEFVKLPATQHTPEIGSDSWGVWREHKQNDVYKAECDNLVNPRFVITIADLDWFVLVNVIYNVLSQLAVTVNQNK